MRQRLARGRGRGGFTLLEVLIASTLLAIVSAGTYAIFSASYRFQLAAQHRLEAMHLARQGLENLVPLSYDAVVGLTPNPTIEALASGTRTTTVVDVPGAYAVVTVTMVRND